MPRPDWRKRAGTPFECEKRPAMGTRGMVVTNHPLASAAGAEILSAGGNAFDAATGSLFTLSVVDPMMVGIFGGGTAVIRLADGREIVLDGLSTAPAITRPDSYTPISDTWPDYMETQGRANRVGPKAIAVPGNLKAWCEVAARFGKLDLAALVAPAIRHAENGFRLSHYLATCIQEIELDLALHEGVGRHQLAGLRVGHGLPAERRGPPLDIPAHRNGGVEDALGDRLQSKRQEARAALDRDEARSIVQAVEVLADHDRIEQRKPVVAKQHRNLAQRIGGVHRFVAPGRAGLMVHDLEPVGDACFMGHHQHLAGVGRVGLVEEPHRRSPASFDLALGAGRARHPGHAVAR